MLTTWRHKVVAPSPWCPGREELGVAGHGTSPGFPTDHWAFDPGATGRVLTSDFSMDWGYEAAKVIANRWPQVDAVVSANDLIALGVIQGSVDLGRSVPQDLAVTGCDDTFFSGVSRPTVTSVAQPALGARSNRYGPIG